MRRAICNGFIAAALGTTFIAASAIPAFSQVARPQSALAAGVNDHDELLTLARVGGGGRGGGGGGFSGGGIRSGGSVMRSSGGNSTMMLRQRGRSVDVARGFDVARGSNVARRSDVARASDPRRWDGNDWRRRHRHDGNDHHHRCWNGRCWPYWGFAFYGYSGYDDYYYDDDYYYYQQPNDAVAYCMSRFRTYNPATGTYKGKDGRRHACP